MICAHGLHTIFHHMFITPTFFVAAGRCHKAIAHASNEDIFEFHGCQVCFMCGWSWGSFARKESWDLTWVIGGDWTRAVLWNPLLINKLVVSNMFSFTSYLGKIPILTNLFHRFAVPTNYIIYTYDMIVWFIYIHLRIHVGIFPNSVARHDYDYRLVDTCIVLDSDDKHPMVPLSLTFWCGSWQCWQANNNSAEKSENIPIGHEWTAC